MSDEECVGQQRADDPSQACGQEAARAAMSAEERAVQQRADDLGLPERLVLGLSLQAMKEHVEGLPADAVEQCDAKVEASEDGEPRYPPNQELNGYVNQFHVEQQCLLDGLSMCERLQRRGEPGVGVATVFVSWHLEAPLSALLGALQQYLAMHPALPRDTRFWVCDFVIRQGQGAESKADVDRLGACVCAVGHTVLLMEPWPLCRAYCIKELFHTQASGARFAMVMTAKQQRIFEQALLDDLRSIMMNLSSVDVRTAKCRKEEEQEAIVRELGEGVGLAQGNKAVVGLLWDALAAQGQAALARLPQKERGMSSLINHLALLLKSQGRPAEAEPLYREALAARRAALGDRHRRTLASAHHLAQLLRAEGRLGEAEPLLREAMAGRREALGGQHLETIASTQGLAQLLQAQGRLGEAERLYREVLAGKRETLGDRHPGTLASVHGLAQLLRARGRLADAEPLFREDLAASRETLGDRHRETLVSLNGLAQLLRDQGRLAEAEPLYREALAGKRETLGDRHSSTLISINGLAELLRAQGRLADAEPLHREALAASREALGDRHPHTLVYVNGLAVLLKAQGRLAEAEPLYREVLAGSREERGDRHPHTLTYLYNLAGLLEAQNNLEGAVPLFREALEGRAAVFGAEHDKARDAARRLVKLLRDQGQQTEAEELAAQYRVEA